MSQLVLPEIISAQLLLQRNRYSEAEEHARRALGLDPQSGLAHSLLSAALSGQKRHQEALAAARQSVALAPDAAFAHRTLGVAYLELSELPASRRAIKESIRLDPDLPNSYLVLGLTYSAEQAWSAALSAAEEGLRLDPEHVDCANLRARSLMMLGRKQEAGVQLGDTLAREPENAHTHANQGWALLHRNQPRQAMEHFREALRLQPNFAWAQSGIVEAMKARNPIYRVMLAYFLWMGRLSPRTQWAVIIGVYFGSRLVRQLSVSQPALAPVLQPLLYLFYAFVFLSWTAESLFDLLLRISPFGRLALSPQQIRTSNWTGACLLFAGLLLAAGLTLDGNLKSASLAAALHVLLLVIPVSFTFGRSPAHRFRFLAACTFVLFVFVCLDVVMRLQPQPSYLYSNLYLVGLVVFLWTANIASTRPTARSRA